MLAFFYLIILKFLFKQLIWKIIWDVGFLYVPMKDVNCPDNTHIKSYTRLHKFVQLYNLYNFMQGVPERQSNFAYLLLYFLFFISPFQKIILQVFPQ